MLRFALLASLAACFSTTSQPCGDLVCPSDLQCSPARDRCVRGAQITACDGLADRAACTIDGADGVCSGGACLPAVCGDGIREGLEDCDGDDLGSNADCHTKGGYYDAPGLACSPSCRYDFTACTGFCGDGVINGNEVCDGQSPQTASCLDFGYDTGALACLPHFCTPDFARCGRIGWERLATPTVFDLHGVWLDSPRDVYAVGYTVGSATLNIVIHFDGTTWTTIPIGTPGHLFDITGTRANDLYIAGAANIVHFDGTTWTNANVPAATYNAIFARAPGDVFAVADTGAIVHFDGTSWQSTAATTQPLRAVWARTASDAWAVGDGPTALHYDGSAWTTTTIPGADTNGFTGVTGTGATVYINNTDQLLYLDGAGWHAAPLIGPSLRLWASGDRVFVPTARAIDVLGAEGNRCTFTDLGSDNANAIASDASGHVFAVGDGGMVRAYRGTMWEFVNITPLVWAADATHVFGVKGGSCYQLSQFAWIGTACAPANLHAIGGSSASNVVGVGGGGAIVRYNGTSWNRETSPDASATLFGVWVSASETFAVGLSTTGVVLHATGSTWSELAIPANTQALFAVWGADVNHVFAVGQGGQVLISNGTTWTASMLPGGPDLLAVWGTSASDVWAAGITGTIVHFDGTAWTPYASHTIERLRALWGTGPNDVFAAGDAGIVLHYDGHDWSPLRSPETTTAISLAGDGRRVYVGGFAHYLDRTSFTGTCAASETSCNDGLDDDCDFLVDCLDPDCAADPVCQ